MLDVPPLAHIFRGPTRPSPCPQRTSSRDDNCCCNNVAYSLRPHQSSQVLQPALPTIPCQIRPLSCHSSHACPWVPESDPRFAPSLAEIGAKNTDHSDTGAAFDDTQHNWYCVLRGAHPWSRATGGSWGAWSHKGVGHLLWRWWILVATKVVVDRVGVMLPSRTPPPPLTPPASKPHSPTHPQLPASLLSRCCS